VIIILAHIFALLAIIIGGFFVWVSAVGNLGGHIRPDEWDLRWFTFKLFFVGLALLCAGGWWFIEGQDALL